MHVICYIFYFLMKVKEQTKWKYNDVPYHYFSSDGFLRLVKLVKQAKYLYYPFLSLCYVLHEVPWWYFKEYFSNSCCHTEELIVSTTTTNDTGITNLHSNNSKKSNLSTKKRPAIFFRLEQYVQHVSLPYIYTLHLSYFISCLQVFFL